MREVLEKFDFDNTISKLQEAGLLFQVLERQGRGGLSDRNGKPLDEPISQNADTTDAALVKVLPIPDQVRWLR